MVALKEKKEKDAEHFLQKAAGIFTETKDSISLWETEVLTAQSFLSQNQSEKANQILLSLPDDFPSTITMYRSKLLGQSFFQKEKYTESIDAFEIALTEAETSPNLKKPNNHRTK